MWAEANFFTMFSVSPICGGGIISDIHPSRKSAAVEEDA